MIPRCYEVRDYQETPTFVREEANRRSNENFPLPGQPLIESPHVGGGKYCAPDYNMNSPGDCRDHDNDFSGIYEADSNYRWRKVRGNLDLFVMERNERHLTSLQWKWQKMSRSRRRTPGYEQQEQQHPPPEFFNGDVAEVYKQLPESARTKSRAESRQRMREDLDTYFYERWKNADDRQNVPQGTKGASDEFGSNTQEKVPRQNARAEYDFYPVSGGQPQGVPYNPRNANTSRWSRYGYFPGANSYPNSIPPSSYQQRFANDPMGNQTQGRYREHQQYFGNGIGHRPTTMYAKPQHNSYSGQVPNPNSYEQNDDFGIYPNEGSPIQSFRNYPPHQSDWNRRSSRDYRQPPYYQQDHGYPNMGYASDYMHYHQPPPSSHISHQAQNSGQHYRPPNPRHGYEQNNNVDPWNKKEPSTVFTPKQQQQVFPTAGEERSRTSVSRRHRRNKTVAGLVNTVLEENGDDDVFVSPLTPPPTMATDASLAINPWLDQSTVTPTMSKKENSNLILDFEFGKPASKSPGLREKKIAPMSPNDFFHNASNSSGNDQGKPQGGYLASVTRLPPLRATRPSTSSTHKSTHTSPVISPSSSTLSASRMDARSVRTRSSTKRVAFAKEISQCDQPASSRISLQSVGDKSPIMIVNKPPSGIDSADIDQIYQRNNQEIVSAKGSTEILGLSSRQSPSMIPPFGAVNDMFSDTEKSHLVEITSHLKQTDNSQKVIKDENSQTVLNGKANDEHNLFIPSREMTTIHVGDIDVKSERGLSSLLFSNESAEVKTEMLNINNKSELQENRREVKDEDEEVEKSPSSPQENKPDNPSGKKSKQSFWELTKRLRQRVGTKLSLKRDNSDVRQELSSRGSVKSPATLDSPKSETYEIRKPATPLIDKPFSLSATNGLPTAEKGLAEAQIATLCNVIGVAKLKNQNQNSPINDEPPNAMNIESPEQDAVFCLPFTEENTLVASNSFPDTENLKLIPNEHTPRNENKPNTPKENQEKIQAKNKNEENVIAGFHAKVSTPNVEESEKDYYHHHHHHDDIHMQKHLHPDDQATNQLFHEQKQMESELHNLRLLLNEELSRNHDNNDLNENFNKKIEEIEKQIIDMDKKLSETSTKLKEAEKQQSATTSDEGLPPNAPLFILADPELGTAAAVAQGGFNYHNGKDLPVSMATTRNYPMIMTPGGDTEEPYQEVSYYNGSVTSPSSYSTYNAALDETKKHQEELKADLENQMAALKKELEQQLRDKTVEDDGRDESDMVIDVRVTNLELKIAEMNHKIEEAESIILKANEEKIKRKLQSEKQAEQAAEVPPTNSSPPSCSTPKTTVDPSPNLNKTPSLSLTPKLTKKLKELDRHSLRKLSPKVSPDPLRRSPRSDSFNLENENHEVKKKIQKMFDANGETSNVQRDGDCEKQLRASRDQIINGDDDDDDDVIILQDEEVGAHAKHTKGCDFQGNDKFAQSLTTGCQDDQVSNMSTVIIQSSLGSDDEGDLQLFENVFTSNKPLSEKKSGSAENETKFVSDIPNIVSQELVKDAEPNLDLPNTTHTGTFAMEVKNEMLNQDAEPTVILNSTTKNENSKSKSKKDQDTLTIIDLADKGDDGGNLKTQRNLMEKNVNNYKTFGICDSLETRSDQQIKKTDDHVLIEGTEVSDKKSSKELIMTPRKSEMDEKNVEILAQVLETKKEKSKKGITFKKDQQKINVKDSESSIQNKIDTKSETSRIGFVNPKDKAMTETCVSEVTLPRNVVLKQQPAAITAKREKEQKPAIAKNQLKKSVPYVDATKTTHKEKSGAPSKDAKKGTDKPPQNKTKDAGIFNSRSFFSRFRSEDKTKVSITVTGVPTSKAKSKSETKQATSQKKTTASSSVATVDAKLQKPQPKPSWFQRKMGKKVRSGVNVTGRQVFNSYNHAEKSTKEDIEIDKIPHRKEKNPNKEPRIASGGTDLISKSSKSELKRNTSPSQSTKTKIPGSKLTKNTGCFLETEASMTTIDSKFTQIENTTSTAQSRRSDWASMSSRGAQGWEERPGTKMSLLQGLGTSWCVCPPQLWKYLGDESDDEPVTRRKCVSLIMGVILALLLLAIVIGLIIGLASSIQAPTESPIRFVVIGAENETGQG